MPKVASINKEEGASVALVTQGLAAAVATGRVSTLLYVTIEHDGEYAYATAGPTGDALMLASFMRQVANTLEEGFWDGS